MRIRWKIAQAAEIRWWQQYLRKKSPAEYLAWKSQYWHGFLAECGLDLPPAGATCLDAGCGPAGIFMILEAQQVDAVDPLLRQYEEKLPNIFQPEAYPWVRFLPSPIETFEPSTPYDFIFCLNAINHVSDWAGSIQQLMQCLKPGGRLVLSTDVHRYGWLKPIFRAIPGDILHPHQHSLLEYRQALEKYNPLSMREILIKREAIFDYYVWVLEI